MIEKRAKTAVTQVDSRKIKKSLLLSDRCETAKVSAGLPVSPDAIRMFRLMLIQGEA